MPRLFERWVLALIALMSMRLVGMALLPFIETTEPRYAEIARLMAETGDWITPWFEPGVPFWGKPPLSFWMQALSIKAFGTSEFALRLPSWLATLVIIFLTWCYARQIAGTVVARCSALVLASMALLYVSAGAVMTDAYLAVGTTLSLVSFGMVVAGKQATWRWLFFLGLAIGLLSKGPLASVLCAIPVMLRFCITRERNVLKAFPWTGGAVATGFLVLPWYVAAEIKTPGFLEYFLVGEHVLRFIDPGWTGDMYGSAHDEPKGMIWIFWVWASFPWGIVALFGLAQHVWRGRGKLIATLRKDKHVCFLLFCAVSPLLFFTLAGNTLWTYALPSLPFTAILVARWLVPLTENSRVMPRLLPALTVLVPIVMTSVVLIASAGFIPLKTEKALALRYESLRVYGDSPLLYVNKLPFSARFYSEGNARLVTQEDLTTMLRSHAHRRYFVVLPKELEVKILDLVGPHYTVEAASFRHCLISFGNAD